MPYFSIEIYTEINFSTSQTNIDVLYDSSFHHVLASYNGEVAREWGAGGHGRQRAIVVECEGRQKAKL